MKLIEPTNKKVERDHRKRPTGLLKQRMAGTKTGEKSEQAILAHFLSSLDNRYIMFHNLQIESLDVPFPVVLVGPPGLALINFSHEKGFFKADDDSWAKMDNTSHRFSPVQPNLIKQTQEYAQRLGMLLDIHDKVHPKIAPILIFARPGVNIESSNPAIRIVMMDGVDNFIASFIKSSEVLRPNEVDYLADALEELANPDRATPLEKSEAHFERDRSTPDVKAESKIPTISNPAEMRFPPIEQKLKFTQKQWVMVAILLSLTIVVLLVVIVYVLSIF